MILIGAAVPSPASRIADLTWAEAGTLRCSIPPSRMPSIVIGRRSPPSIFAPIRASGSGHALHRPRRQRGIAGEGRANAGHARDRAHQQPRRRCRYCRNRSAPGDRQAPPRTIHSPRRSFDLDAERLGCALAVASTSSLSSRPRMRVSPSAMAPRISARWEQLLSPGIAASPSSGAAGRRDQLHPSSAATWAARSIAWARLRRGSQAVSQFFSSSSIEAGPRPPRHSVTSSALISRCTPAAVDALGPGDGEEGVDLGEDVGQAANLALAAHAGVAVHRVDRPDHRPALVAHCAHQRRQQFADLFRAEPADQDQLAGPVERIEPVDQPQQLIGRQRRAAFHADDILDSAQIFDMRAVDLARAIAQPQHMARGRPPAPGRIAASQRLLIGQQQRLMAGEDRRPAATRRGEAGGRADRLHMRADHPLRIGLARRRFERNAVDDVAAIGGQASRRHGFRRWRCGAWQTGLRSAPLRPTVRRQRAEAVRTWRRTGRQCPPPARRPDRRNFRHSRRPGAGSRGRSASPAIASRSRAASSIPTTGAAPASRASTASQQRFVGIIRHLARRMAAPAGREPAAVRNKRRTHRLAP